MQFLSTFKKKKNSTNKRQIIFEQVLNFIFFWSAKLYGSITYEVDALKCIVHYLWIYYGWMQHKLVGNYLHWTCFSYLFKLIDFTIYSICIKLILKMFFTAKTH